MAKTMSMNRYESSTETFNIRESDWSDLNYDVLFLVMMQLGVVDFFAFSGVCKSWRSFALLNNNTFMRSKPPMSLSISSDDNGKNCYCHLKDHEGRMFKTTLPHSTCRHCVGLTCGYLVFVGRKTNDFWLVNPITRHELRFPAIPSLAYYDPTSVRAILVFSPSISGWVFVMSNGYNYIKWISTAGQGSWKWNDVSLQNSSIVDLLAFKGKIYGISNSSCLCELKFSPEPELKFLKTKSVSIFSSCQELVSSGENLYLVVERFGASYMLFKLDIEEIKWVFCRQTREECAFYYSRLLKHSTAVKPESLAAQPLQYEKFAITFSANMWYFPHECLNINLID